MSWSPRLRIWMGLFALGFLGIAAEGGRDALRPKDDRPRRVTAAELPRLPEGAWVEVEGMLDLESAREVQGVFRSTGVFLVQLAQEPREPNVVIITNTTRSPSFVALRGGGWLTSGVKRATHDAGAEGDAVDPAVAYAVGQAFGAPQKFQGVLYKPGGQSFGKSDVHEIDGEKVKIGGYCSETSRCTTDQMALVVGEEPKSRVLSIAQMIGAGAAGLALLGLALFGNRPKPAPVADGPAFRQIAGEDCPSCKRTIVKHVDGCLCETCGLPTHIDCAARHALECSKRSGAKENEGPYRAS